MGQKRRPRAGRSAARSPEVVARLERLRQQTVERRAAAREKEKTVTAAVRGYISAWHAIRIIEQRRDQEIASLRQQIDDTTARAAAEIAEYHRAQADNAATIQAQGHNDTEIAKLLEITPKQARQLLATARQTGAAQERRDGQSTPQHTEKPATQQVSPPQSVRSPTEATDARSTVHVETAEDWRPTSRG
ncbi:hypothetical protein [Nocardia wallacei]|uniref:hypothetical protein n=1 Tax=Nocardia wallacei TaxID=480035 RepID=UPI002454A87C|nr:hypothetical protein [Nocardia wallacei]